MNLPIELIPCSLPPRFRWRQLVDTPNGQRTIDHEGQMPVTIEGAVVSLIDVAKQQAQEIAGLNKRLEAAYERIASQSDALGKKAEVQQSLSKKGK